MIHVLTGNVWSYIEEPNTPEAALLIKLLDESLKIKDPAGLWTPRSATYYKRRKKTTDIGATSEKLPPATWDGCSHYITKNGRFLTGLLPKILQTAEELGTKNIKVASVSSLSQPVHPNLRLVGVDLTTEQRSYQKFALTEALRLRRGILALATNAGKTEIGCALAWSLNDFNLQLLWLTHRLDLVTQTKERIESRTTLKASVVGETHCEIDGDVVVATVQTLSKRMYEPHIRRWLNTVPAIVLDECHRGTSKQWSSILHAAQAASYRIGLSGTPFTEDENRNRLLIGCLGEVMAKVSNQELISRKVSVPPLVVPISFEHTFKYKSYQTAISSGIIQNERRNKLISKICSRMEKSQKGLVVVTEIRHGEALQQMLSNAGLRVAFLNGLVTTSNRRTGKRKMRSGDLDVIVATNIFDEGIDIPELDYLMLARPTKSLVRILQRTGRVLRSAEGKTSARVYFIDDRGNRYLESFAKTTRNVLAKEGFELL